jgi:hypothetical protein
MVYFDTAGGKFLSQINPIPNPLPLHVRLIRFRARLAGRVLMASQDQAWGK